MFRDDSVGRLFAAELSEAARRGVEVTVTYDALGSLQTPRAFFERMRRADVDVRAVRPFELRRWRKLFRRDHRKLLVADGEVAFIGGMNLSAHSLPERGAPRPGWRDDVLRIEGPAVKHLEQRFHASWRMHFSKRLRRLRELLAARRARGVQGRGDLALAVLSSRRSIHRAYLHAIARARRTVYIATAYFSPDRRLLRVLEEAARRGVRVELILNARSDHPVMNWVARAFYERLLSAGVHIYEWGAGMLHAKTAVVDGIWGTIGSFNLDRVSLDLNDEMNVAFADPRLGSELEAAFLADRARCAVVALETWRKRPAWARAIEVLLFPFQSLL
jgi:cardiolipin synthase